MSKRHKTTFNTSLHAILHPLSKFNTNRPKWCQNIEKKSKWRPIAILDLQNFYFCQMTNDRIEINLVYLIIFFSKKINSQCGITIFCLKSEKY